jgi:hypothetical protein
MPTKLLSRFADTVGDGSGDVQATGTYAGSPTAFKLMAQPGEVIHVHRMIVSIESAAITNADIYAGAGLLSVGISVYVTDTAGEIYYNLTDENEPIVNIGSWAHYCYDLNIWAGLAGGNDHAAVRWTFAKAVPHGVELLPGWAVNVLCEDDLDDLAEHHFLMQGHFDDDSLPGGAFE